MSASEQLQYELQIAEKFLRYAQGTLKDTRFLQLVCRTVRPLAVAMAEADVRLARTRLSFETETPAPPKKFRSLDDGPKTWAELRSEIGDITVLIPATGIRVDLYRNEEEQAAFEHLPFGPYAADDKPYLSSARYSMSGYENRDLEQKALVDAHGCRENLQSYGTFRVPYAPAPVSVDLSSFMYSIQSQREQAQQELLNAFARGAVSSVEERTYISAPELDTAVIRTSQHPYLAPQESLVRRVVRRSRFQLRHFAQDREALRLLEHAQEKVKQEVKKTVEQSYAYNRETLCKDKACSVMHDSTESCEQAQARITAGQVHDDGVNHHACNCELCDPENVLAKSHGLGELAIAERQRTPRQAGYKRATPTPEPAELTQLVVTRYNRATHGSETFTLETKHKPGGKGGKNEFSLRGHREAFSAAKNTPYSDAAYRADDMTAAELFEFAQEGRTEDRPLGISAGAGRCYPWQVPIPRAEFLSSPYVESKRTALLKVPSGSRLVYPPRKENVFADRWQGPSLPVELSRLEAHQDELGPIEKRILREEGCSCEECSSYEERSVDPMRYTRTMYRLTRHENVSLLRVDLQPLAEDSYHSLTREYTHTIELRKKNEQSDLPSPVVFSGLDAEGLALAKRTARQAGYKAVKTSSQAKDRRFEQDKPWEAYPVTEHGTTVPSGTAAKSVLKKKEEDEWYFVEGNIDGRLRVVVEGEAAIPVASAPVHYGTRLMPRYVPFEARQVGLGQIVQQFVKKHKKNPAAGLLARTVLSFRTANRLRQLLWPESEEKVGTVLGFVQEDPSRLSIVRKSGGYWALRIKLDESYKEVYLGAKRLNLAWAEGSPEDRRKVLIEAMNHCVSEAVKHWNIYRAEEEATQNSYDAAFKWVENAMLCATAAGAVLELQAELKSGGRLEWLGLSQRTSDLPNLFMPGMKKVAAALDQATERVPIEDSKLLDKLHEQTKKEAKHRQRVEAESDSKLLEQPIWFKAKRLTEKQKRKLETARIEFLASLPNRTKSRSEVMWEVATEEEKEIEELAAV